MSFETDLRGALREHAAPITASAHLRALDYRPRSERVRPLRLTAAVALIACATAIAIGVGSTWDDGTPLAQAFPVLSGPTTLTPASLGRALKIYGVDPSNDGLNIQHARPVPTPWGQAFVLTNAAKEFVCVAVPAPEPVGWVASCNQAKRAETYGTAPVSFAYNKARDSVRVVALVPAGATASLITASLTATVVTHDNLLALTAKPGSEIQITVHDRSFVGKVTRGAPAQISSPGSSPTDHDGGSSTTAASVSRG
jgi:hypothetical protein